MASLMSKRQQARNEKTLQDLVHNVDGNDECADCQARNPSWASWSLGIFLCMRCAAIHRKLGTHISKVKSLSMDAWTSEQVENMKKVGNIRSNLALNPQNKRPSPPVDIDEADSVMERFIRQKYVDAQKALTRTRVLAQDDELPPPLPPKSPPSGGSRVSLRSASNIFPLSSRAKREVAATANIASANVVTVSPRHANKPSQVFGATVEYDASEDTDRKLAKLRNMGFADLQRNAMVLKGVGGNLDRAVEALIRLGEGDGRRSSTSIALPSPASQPLASPAGSALRDSRSLTPVSSTGRAAGAGQARAMSRDGPETPSTVVSTNPFDMLPPQPQSAQSTGNMHSKNPYGVAGGVMYQMSQQDLASQAFGNMSLSTPAQLFPNHTGGFPAQQQPLQQQYLQQSMTPPVASQPFMPFGQQQFYRSAQPLQPQHTANPFLNQQMFLQQQNNLQQQQQQPQALQVNTTGSQSNPFVRSPTRIQSPSSLGQIPEQSQAAFYSQLQQQHLQQSLQQQQQQQQQQLQQHHLQQQQQLYMQHQAQLAASNNPFAPPVQQAQVQRPDKASIMALYNYPHLAPPPLAQQTQNEGPPTSKNPFAVAVAPASAPVSSPTQPAATPSTPAANTTATPASPDAKHNPTRDSIAFGLEMGWSNGRHSPDAFASLSSRHR